MIILGIDPGTSRVGYGVITLSRGSLTHVRSGLLDVGEDKENSARLNKIKTSLEILLDETHPEKVGVERLFFSKNKKTALAVAEARGVIISTITARNIPLIELTPNEVKSAVAGSGTADKKGVAKMVSLILKIPTSSLLDDVTDALAIAIASANKR